jgi:hypothetical protein
MTDRECALRFLAFAITPYSHYRSSDLDGFLNAQMKYLNGATSEERASLSLRFYRSMDIAWRLFERDAFRKRYRQEDHRKPINKALFEAWSVGLDKQPDALVETLVERREQLREGFIALMNDRAFDSAISQGTGDPSRVQLRFSAIENLIAGVLS